MIVNIAPKPQQLDRPLVLANLVARYSSAGLVEATRRQESARSSWRSFLTR